jgi:hypothetical protein
MYGACALAVSKTAGKDGNNFKTANWRGARYPWEKWFGKGTFTLLKGRDFRCTLSGMTINVRVAARRHGLRVRIDQGDNRLTVTVKGSAEVTAGGAE